MTTHTIFIVDDDPSIRAGLVRLIRSAGYLARAFDSAEAFFSGAGPDAVGCLILDMKLPDVGGLEMQDRLQPNGYDLPVVFLTGHGDVHSSVRAMKHGATDFLTKPVDERDLLEAVNASVARHQALRAAAELRRSAVHRARSLTPREYETMRCVIAGLLNKQIAARLGIAEKTVKIHRGRLMHKMGARAVAELVRVCAIAGVEPASSRPRSADRALGDDVPARRAA